MGKMKPAAGKALLEELLRPPPTVFKLTLHGLVCVTTLILGFRASREALPILINQAPQASFPAKSINEALPVPGMNFRSPFGNNGGRVHAGRHRILVRPWPHPQPKHTMLAHRLMGIVQKMQREMYGVKDRRRLIAITPTYVQAFQAIYITALIHTLKLVPGPLIWIVVEAGGKSNETAAMLANSGLPFVHLSSADAMPSGSESQMFVKMRLRTEGLRFVRDQHLDGIVVFADDSITYDLAFFDEVQRVQWIGALSLGLLSEPDIIGVAKDDSGMGEGRFTTREEKVHEANRRLPIHGPVCNSAQQLIGWYSHSVNSGKQQSNSDENPKSQKSFRTLDWASFVVNAQVLWKDAERPPWILKWDYWVQGNQVDFLSPLDMVKDIRFVEPLGNCGQEVWLWRFQVEAPAGSDFPHSWELETPLYMIPSKHTPWLEKPVISTLPPAIFHSTVVPTESQDVKGIRLDDKDSHHAARIGSYHEKSIGTSGDNIIQ